MNGFSAKKIDQQKTLAEILVGRRLELNLEIEDAERELKINKKYLKAFEDGEFDRLPSDIYAKNFLRGYVAWLKLSFEEMWVIFEREKTLFEKVRRVKNTNHGVDVIGGHGLARENTWALLSSQNLKRLIIAGVILVFLGYLGIQLRNIMRPPYLEVLAPEDNIIVTSESVEVSGLTEPEVEIKINQEDVAVNEQGEWSKKISLQQGVNTIEVVAQKKHGAATVASRQIMYNPPTDTTVVVGKDSGVSTKK